jgi:hypothetical protein
MHFSDDWTTYLYFAQWGDAQLATDPQTIVRLEDWLLVSEENCGGRIKGDEILQPPSPLIEIKDGGMFGRTGNTSLSNLTLKIGNKRTPTTPRQLDLRTMFPSVACARSQEDRNRDKITDEILAQQEKKEITAAARSQARREKYAAAANLKVNGLQGLSDNRKLEQSDAEMEETDGTPVPTARRGSKHRKNLRKPKHLQLIENKNCLFKLALLMAISLRESVDLHTKIKEAVPEFSTIIPMQATALFPNTSDRVLAAVHFTPSLDLPPTGTKPGPYSDTPSGNTTLPLIPADRGTSALHPTRYSVLPHNQVPPNETDTVPDRTMFSQE